jgi:hypothetical protein
MSLGVILEICFIWFLFLGAMGLVLINLSIVVWGILKRTWKNSEQWFAHETKSQMKASIWKPRLDDTPAASTK